LRQLAGIYVQEPQRADAIGAIDGKAGEEDVATVSSPLRPFVAIRGVIRELFPLARSTLVQPDAPLVQFRRHRAREIRPKVGRRGTSDAGRVRRDRGRDISRTFARQEAKVDEWTRA